MTLASRALPCDQANGARVPREATCVCEDGPSPRVGSADAIARLNLEAVGFPTAARSCVRGVARATVDKRFDRQAATPLEGRLRLGGCGVRRSLRPKRPFRVCGSRGSRTRRPSPRKQFPTDGAARDLFKAGKVARSVTVGTRVGPFEDTPSAVPVGDGFAAGDSLAGRAFASRTGLT
jgi:hypothetical protein